MGGDALPGKPFRGHDSLGDKRARLPQWKKGRGRLSDKRTVLVIKVR